MSDFDISKYMDIDDGDDGENIVLIPVVTPSGATVEVMSQDEADFYNDRRERYVTENKFQNVSDVLELDRVLTMELMVYRWGLWLLSGTDYQGRKASADQIQKNINSYSKEIRELKSALGVDKLTREKDKGTNFAEYMTMLRQRAHEFGVHRNNQLIEAINILNELFAAATAYRNMNDKEQREFGYRAEDVIDLILERQKKYDAIDDKFKEQQRIWIRDLNRD